MRAGPESEGVVGSVLLGGVAVVAPLEVEHELGGVVFRFR